jgi:hypothetical protein
MFPRETFDDAAGLLVGFVRLYCVDPLGPLEIFNIVDKMRDCFLECSRLQESQKNMACQVRAQRPCPTPTSTCPHQ